MRRSTSWSRGGGGGAEGLHTAALPPKSGTTIIFQAHANFLGQNSSANKKPRYRKDDRAMHPIYEFPENCM